LFLQKIFLYVFPIIFQSLMGLEKLRCDVPCGTTRSYFHPKHHVFTFCWWNYNTLLFMITPCDRCWVHKENVAWTIDFMSFFLSLIYIQKPRQNTFLPSTVKQAHFNSTLHRYRCVLQHPWLLRLCTKLNNIANNKKQCQDIITIEN